MDMKKHAEMPHHRMHHGLMIAAAAENRAEDRARDQWRHPVETVMFFEVEPDMKVGAVQALGLMAGGLVLMLRAMRPAAS